MESELRAELLWQMLSEPGDELAGFLVRQVSAARLLSELKSDSVVQKWCDYCESDDPALTKFVPAAVERLRLRFQRIDLNQAISRAAVFDFVPRMVKHFPQLEQQFLDLGPAAPRVLWVAGDAQVVELPGLGLVGSRQCTGYGVSVVQGLIDRLTDGQSVVSGGALGIDTAAHRAALTVGVPTVSYLAGGPDRLYPSANLPLFERIKRAGGALIAECAPGTPPGRWRFLQRNRLIAAQSKVLVVAECGYRSGARNTATIAGDLGRAVFAAPGPINSSASAGCNLMIAHDRAQCLADFDEPIDTLLGHVSKREHRRRRPPNEQRISDELEPTGQSADELACRAGLSVREAVKALESLLDRNEARRIGDKWALPKGRGLD